ncbi:MAG: gliding motility-associated C-terminal domain-containing protein [Flavobacteriales bacterium]|nr:gliding motility-associated C-terminal domain-containing protein [Flavobacteriales bacterium]
MPDPVVLFPETDEATYPVWLHVTNQYGCPDSVMKLVFIEGVFSVYVPNAFTPDGDGINDTFGPLGQGISDKDFAFTVFDRWGEAIFKTNDPATWWEGTSGGTQAMQGVYAWRLDLVDRYRNLDRQYYGHVTLVR